MASPPPVWDRHDHAQGLYDRVNAVRETMRRLMPGITGSPGPLGTALRDLDILCLELETTSLIEAEAGVQRIATPDAIWLRIPNDGGHLGLIQ